MTRQRQHSWWKAFATGFDIGYQGPTQCRSCSNNIPLMVGSYEELWAKVLKEVDQGRVAGPFNEVRFDNFIQSPVGLVPKSGGKTRLIFHLSYDFEGQEPSGSVNKWTPKHLCSVKYNDLDVAVKECLNLCKQFTEEGKERPTLFLGKTDLSSAFRVLPLLISCICWLVFKVRPERRAIQVFYG